MLGGRLESQRSAPGPLARFLPPFGPQGVGRGEKGAQDSRAWGSVLTQKVLTGWQ